MLLRRYSITTGDDVLVIDHTTDPPEDRSSEYQNIVRDPANRRIEAEVEVHDVDGQLDIRVSSSSTPEATDSLQDLVAIVSRDLGNGVFR